MSDAYHETAGDRAEAAWKKWGSSDDEATRLDRRGFIAGYEAAIAGLGFTREDVRLLRVARLDLHGSAATDRYSAPVQQEYRETAERLNDIADRIESLLPPEEEADG